MLKKARALVELKVGYHRNRVLSKDMRGIIHRILIASLVLTHFLSLMLNH